MYDDVANKRVQQNLDPRLGEHVKGSDLIEFGIVDDELAGDGTAGRDQPIEQLTHRSAGGSVGDVEQVHHGCRAGAAEGAEALDQQRAGARAPRGERRHHARDAAAYYQHIDVVRDRNLACRLDYPS